MVKRNSIWVHFFIFITSINCIVGQNEMFSLDNFSVAQGLPHAHITSVIHHENGFLYLGTRNGLCRFDGYEFQKINLPEKPNYMYGAVGPFIYSLGEMHDGRLLIHYKTRPGAQNEFCTLLDVETVEFEEVLKSEIDSSLLIESPVHSEYFYNESKTEVERVEFTDMHNNIFRIDYRNSNLPILHLIPHNGNPIALSNIPIENGDRFRPTGRDFRKAIFIFKNSGMLRIIPKNDLFQKHLNRGNLEWQYGNKIRAVAPLDSFRFFASSENEPLAIVNINSRDVEYPKLTFHRSNTPFDSKYLVHIANAGDSTYWFTSYFSHISLFDLKTSTVKIVPGINNYLNYHSLLLKDKSLISFGFHPKKGVQLSHISPEGELVYQHRVEFRNSINANSFFSVYMLQSQDGKVWVGNDNGIFVYNAETKNIEKAYRSESFKGEMDAGYPQYKILKGKAVLCLLEDRNENIWVGLDGDGVNIIDQEKNSIAQVINKEEGLENETVAGMIEDKKGVWLSTYSGLYHYNTQSERMSHYTTQEGLTHDEFNRMSFNVAGDGSLLFGGMNGLINFDPNKLEQNNKQEILLSAAKYFNDRGQEITQYFNFSKLPSFTIPSNYRACSFRFTLSDFTSESGLSFEYQLKESSRLNHNVENQWIQNGSNPEIAFNYLPSGNHTLFVRSKSPLGHIPEQYRLNLIVKEYFYKTWWFGLLIFTFLSGLFYLFFKYKLNQAIRIEKLKTQLSSNLHDDVGSVLSGVAYQMELLEYSVSEEQKPLVRKIAMSSRSAMNKMRDVVWAIDSRNDTFLDLIERLREFSDEMLSSLNIEYHIDSDPSLYDYAVKHEMRHDLLLICKEFITNTIKHADATKLSIIVETMGKTLVWHLKDNGVGAPRDDKSTGQGLKNMKMRVKKHKGTLQHIETSGFYIRIVLPSP